MKMERIEAVIILFLGLALACQKWEYEPLSFLEVVTEASVIGETGTTAMLMGSINGLLEADLAEQHGHVWSQTQPEPTLSDKDGQTTLGNTGNRAFTSNIEGLAPGTDYYYRAYAIFNNEVQYGAVKVLGNEELALKLEIDSVIMEMISETEVQVVAHNSIEGIPDGLPIASYGLLWGTSGDLSFEKDNVLANQGFVAFTDKIEFETPLPVLEADDYFLQTYLIVNEKTYTSPVSSFSLTDLWRKRSDEFEFPSTLVDAFSIGDKGYVLTLVLGEVLLWEYAEADDEWSLKTKYPGEGALFFVRFSIGNKAYLGGGRMFEPDITAKDFYEYDPVANTFKRLNDLPSQWARESPFTFVIDGIGYMGAGIEVTRPENSPLLETFLNDFWAYDPTSDSWTEKGRYPGITDTGFKVTDLGFAINGKGYAGMGTTVYQGFTDHTDFWEYDPDANTWMRRADFPGTARFGEVGFALGNRGLVGSGLLRDEIPYTNEDKSGEIPLADFWSYEPSSNTWTQIRDFPGTINRRGAGFALGDRGFVITDVNYRCDPEHYFWEYKPE